ncbi:catalase family peroxidase [Pseudomonas sp. QE6]|uniref:catalase family peroxidase n=1 Tax=Pseudomonas sp. QE6 TaxID=3242491 RepID=UPI003528F33D
MQVPYKAVLAGAVLTGVCQLYSTSLNAAEAEAKPYNPVDMISAFEDTYGTHAGQRRNHTKGLCAEGEFVGNSDTAKYSRSALFSGQPIPVVARFSHNGGNPEQPDNQKGVQGLALEFKLPGGALQHMTMINVPIFVSKPETFYALTVALKPDPATGAPNPEALKAFVESHPDFHGLGAAIESRNPPVGYDTTYYNSLNAFWFVNKADQKQLVRWHFEPQGGVKTLTDEEMKATPADHLAKDLIARTQNSPAKWDMYIILGQPGDSENDASIAWPEDRQKVKVGTLSITKAMPQAGAACNSINFDPLVVADGIVPTDDPILKARSAAYAISFGKRMSGQ